MVFVDDDEAYLRWIAANPHARLLNAARSLAVSPTLHRATCHTISGTPARGRVWTGPNIKACADDAAALKRWSEANIGHAPRAAVAIMLSRRRAARLLIAYLVGGFGVRVGVGVAILFVLGRPAFGGDSGNLASPAGDIGAGLVLLAIAVVVTTGAGARLAAVVKARGRSHARAKTDARQIRAAVRAAGKSPPARDRRRRVSGDP